MIAAFSSADQLRRRPAPVNTSMRRTGSGICLCSEIDMCRSLHRLRDSPFCRHANRWCPNTAYGPTPPRYEGIGITLPPLCCQKRRCGLGQSGLHIDHGSVLVEHADLDGSLQIIRLRHALPPQAYNHVALAVTSAKASVTTNLFKAR